VRSSIRFKAEYVHAAVAAALVFGTGCSLLVSTDGLAGGTVPEDHDRETAPEGGGNAKIIAVDKDAGTTTIIDPDGGTTVIDTTSKYAANVRADNPSLYLRFGEAAGATGPKNEMGPLAASYPPSGIALGTPGALQGDPDTAITFTKGIIELPPGQDCANLDDCAFELWMKIDKVQDDYGWVLDHQVWDSRGGWCLENDHGLPNYERWAGGQGQGAVYTKDGFPLHEWHHLFFTFDATGQTFYVDGVERDHQNARNVIPATGAKWTIGGTACFDCSGRAWFEGAIDELAIYEHTVSRERIMAHVAAAR